MADIPSAPRVDASQLSEYEGQVVRIVGRVVHQDQPAAVLGCGESGQVNVQVRMAPGNQWGTSMVEVVGCVGPDGLEEYQSFDLGDNFDLANYQQALQLANAQYRHVFTS